MIQLDSYLELEAFRCSSLLAQTARRRTEGFDTDGDGSDSVRPSSRHTVSAAAFSTSVGIVVGHVPKGDTIVECHQQGVGVPGGDIRERSETVNGISQFSHQECSLRDLLHIDE